MPIVPGGGGNVDFKIWDSILLEAADLEATLFTVPKGQAGKTKYHTNMTASSQLALGNNMQVCALTWWTEPDITKVGLIALCKAYFEVIVSGRIMREDLLGNLPMGATLNADLDGAAAAVEVARVGYPDYRDVGALAKSFMINNMESFEVKIVWGTAPGALRLWFMLHGVLERPLN
jgi:hypothetical protein